MATLTMQVCLIVNLWRGSQARVRPYFFAYSVLLFFSSATLLVGYHALSNSAYFTLYWMVTSVESAVASGVVGELWEQPAAGLIVGLVGAIAMQLSGQPVIAARIAGAVIASGAFLAVFRSTSPQNHCIAVGLVVFLTFPAILYRLHVPQWTTYFPVFAGIAARTIWLQVPEAGFTIRCKVKNY